MLWIIVQWLSLPAFGIFMTSKGLGSCFVFSTFGRWSEELRCLHYFSEPSNLLFCPQWEMRISLLCKAAVCSVSCQGDRPQPSPGTLPAAAAVLSAEESEPRMKDVHLVGLRMQTRVCCWSSPTGVVLEWGNQASRAFFFPYSCW